MALLLGTYNGSTYYGPTSTYLALRISGLHVHQLHTYYGPSYRSTLTTDLLVQQVALVLGGLLHG